MKSLEQKIRDLLFDIREQHSYLSPCYTDALDFLKEFPDGSLDYFCDWLLANDRCEVQA